MNKFENLKAGDFVVESGTYTCGDCLRKVERVTKSQIIVGNHRYWKKDGRLVGAGYWCYAYIRTATEADIERINKVNLKKKLTAFIRQVAWSNLPLESLQAICDIVKKETGNSAEKQ